MMRCLCRLDSNLELPSVDSRRGMVRSELPIEMFTKVPVQEIETTYFDPAASFQTKQVSFSISFVGRGPQQKRPTHSPNPKKHSCVSLCQFLCPGLVLYQRGRRPEERVDNDDQRKMQHISPGSKKRGHQILGAGLGAWVHS